MSSLKSTQGAGVLCLRNDQVLLVQMNYGSFAGSWILPGGMMEPGEHPHETAHREFFEETGCRVGDLNLLFIRHRIYDSDKENNVYFVFRGELLQAEIEPQFIWPKEELMDVKLWSLGEALQAPEVRPQTKWYIQQAVKDQNQRSFLSLEGPHNDICYRVGGDK